MQKAGYRIGPGAPSLILILVILCMTVLSVLSLASAQGDVSLAQRSVTMTEDYYRAMYEAEGTLEEIDGMLATAQATAQDDAAYLALVQQRLPQGVSMRDRILYWYEDARADRRLECEIELLPWRAQGARWAWAGHWLNDAEDFGEFGEPFELIA